MMKKLPHIVVVGSINMDLVITCASLPSPGETVLAFGSREILGGKGANQAVAAARLGSRVSMIGRVGDDSFGQRLRRGIEDESIDTSSVLTVSNTASGMAIIGVESSGQNSILVVPNANGVLSASDINASAPLIRSADVVLLQLEIPTEAVLRTIEIAREAGVKIILDPAPAPVSFPEAFFQVDLFCPNQSEASAILGMQVDSIDEAKLAAQQLVTRGVKYAVVTMGYQGVAFSDGTASQWFAPFKVTTVDTTAAGDAFAAALACRWCETDSIVDAITYGAAAGAVAASRAGAQPSLPSRSDIETLLQQDRI